MAELALDDDERDAFVRHLDGVSVAELMRRAPSPDTGFGGGMMQLLAHCGCLPAASGGRPVDDAQQRADRKLTPDLEPRVGLLPGAAVHPDLTALAALPASDEDGAAGAVQVALLKRERFADPQAGPPEQHDQRPEAMTL